MYFSRFNYVSDHEKDGQRLLMNFLSRSCDIVDEESALCFSEKKDMLSSEEKEYAAERGYLFQSKDQESKILQELHEMERHKKAVSAVHLDTFHGDFREISERVKNKGPLVLYSEDLLDTAISEFAHHPDDMRIVTIGENLSCFEHLFTKRSSQVTLIVPLSGSAFPFEEDTESLLDTLIEHGTTVEICARLKKDDIKKVKPLMNYFIYKGWPFLENFICNLEPINNNGCIFSYWYSSNTEIPRKIFQEYKTYPQTEFCSMEKWVGINPVHSLIWTGKPSMPSFHFCEATRGLTVFTGEGDVPCFNLVGTSYDPEEFTEEFHKKRAHCHECVFCLSCGGGCTLRNQCPPVKELIEAALECYFDEFLERLNFYEQYGGIQ